MHTLEITVQRQRDGAHPVVFEESQDGGALPVRVEGRLVLDQAGLMAAEGDVAVYGRALGDALFAGGLRDAFVEALARTPERLRVLLFVEDQALRGLRWERLHAPIDNEWLPLVRAQRAPFSRYLPSLTDRRFPPIGRRDLRALVVAASPAGLARYKLEHFDLERAVANAKAALGEIPCAVLADLPGAAGRPTLDDLCEHLVAAPYTILHIVAHGRVVQDGETVLYLAGNAGPDAVDPVSGARLIERLRELQGARGLPHLLFLASCETASPDADAAMGGLGQRLVGELGMPAVVAMTEKVAVDTAYELATGFYDRLRDHGEPDRALVEAAAGLSARDDVTVPALFSRLGGRPLFSDTVDRPLTAAEVEFGLERLAAAVAERAPVLQAELSAAAAVARRALGADPGRLSAEARRDQAAAMATIETICGEATELGFKPLALNEPLGAYDPRCPFPGLRSFTAEQRDFFCGRDELVRRLAERLAAHPLLAVVGPSGGGKSSLAFAGLLPMLQERQPGLALASFTPGEQPRQALKAALDALPADAPAVVVVDQLEELFTVCADEAERRGFVEELLALPDRFPTVLTLRADAAGELRAFPQLQELLLAHQEQVPQMAPDELRRAIERQAATVGLRFEAGLSGAIVDSVRGEPGATPLLQHALQELWRRRRGRWLRAEEYERIGGVRQAIAFSAEGIYTRLVPAQQEQLRAIMLRLARLVESDPGRDLPQRAALAELVPAGGDTAPVRAMVTRLASARLLVTGRSPTGEETVEVAHEALIREWPRLRGWLSEDRAALLRRQEIGQAARAWAAAGESADYLLRGLPLDEALALRERPRFALNNLELRFVEAGLARREAELAADEAERRRKLDEALALAEERRQNAERLRRLLALVAAVAAAAVVAAVVALVFRQVAEENRRVAEENRQIADANAREAAQQALVADADAALARGETDQAQALALASIQSDSPQPRAFYVLAEAADGGARRRIDFPASVTVAAFSPDGDLIVAVDRDGNLRALDPATGAEQRQLSLESGGASLAFLPHRSGILVGGLDGSLTIVDAVGAELFDGGVDTPLHALAVAPDGASVFAGSFDGAITRWDVAGRSFDAVLRDSFDPPSPVTGLAFSERGTLLAAFRDGGLVELDPDTGEELGGIYLDYIENDTLQSCSITTMQIYPDLSRNWVYSGCADGKILNWDIGGGVNEAQLFYTYNGHSSPVLSINFSAEGDQFVSSSLDQTVFLWEDDTGKILTEFKGHAGEVNRVAISPLGDQVITAGFDRTLRQWDLRGGQLLRDYTPGINQSDLALARLSDDGAQLTMLDAIATDAVLYRWNVADGELLADRDFPHRWFTLSPDGGLALVDVDDALTVWDLERDAPLATLEGAPSPSESLEILGAFSPAGDLLLLSADGLAPELYRVADGSLVRTFEDDLEIVFSNSMAFSQDGARVIAGSSAEGEAAVAVVWDVASGAILARLVGHQDAVTTVALSADGAQAITGSFDRTVRLWDVETQAAGRVFVGHTGVVRSVAMSPDGSLLLSGAEDQAAILWDVAGGSELARYDDNAGRVSDVGFSADGATAMTGTASGDLRLWRVIGRDALVAWVRENRQPATLSCEQRERYLLPCPAP